MADVMALENSLRTFLDRDPLWNMRCFMFPGVPTVFALSMGSHQGQDERGGFLVNPLINGLRANGEFRVFDGQSSGDKFWGPSQSKAFFDIAPNNVGFKSWSPMGFAVTFIRSFLCFVGQVIAGINRRSIALELPGEGAGTPFENGGNFP
jgi:hypothetical protein